MNSIKKKEREAVQIALDENLAIVTEIRREKEVNNWWRRYHNYLDECEENCVQPQLDGVVYPCCEELL